MRQSFYVNTAITQPKQQQHLSKLADFQFGVKSKRNLSLRGLVFKLINLDFFSLMFILKHLEKKFLQNLNTLIASYTISCNANSHQMTNHIFILSCEHRQVSKWNRIAATAKQHMIFILATKKGIDYCEDGQFQFSAL